jgi:anti-sigma factor RsiW
MLTRLKTLVQRLDVRRHWHPRASELLAFRDGELDLPRQGKLAGHIRACPRCRLEMDRLESSLDRCAEVLADAEAAPPLGRGLQEILCAMRDETLLHAARERLDRERDARLAAQLTPFFGRYPEALLLRSAAGGSSFHSDAEWLLQAFLGRRTASVVLRRIDAEMGVG